MGILNKIFGYRWSLYVTRNNNQLVYAMHENSAIRIVGYVMGYFANGATPVHPWSLHLNFNKKHRSFKLRSEHFTQDGENITDMLIKEIAAIDPGWEVPGNEPIFIEVATKRILSISRKRDYSSIEALTLSGENTEEETFFSVMHMVFGENSV